MLVIGVTGNIGSGKSTVCRILGVLGAAVIDADKLAHEVYKPHSQTWQELVAVFGEGILKPDEEIDREKLGQMVFSHSNDLLRLNQIVHPGAYRLAQERIEAYRCQGARAVALEATLLIEAKWMSLADKVWVVVASEEKVVQRLGQYAGRDEAQILARLRSQMPVEEKIKYADEVIYNDGNMSQLEAKVAGLWHTLTNRANQ